MGNSLSLALGGKSAKSAAVEKLTCHPIQACLVEKLGGMKNLCENSAVAMVVLRIFAILFVAIFFSCVSVDASDCPGMSDYTYEHGSCTDNTGDMFSFLQKSYDRDYELGVERNQRMEGGQSLSGSSAPIRVNSSLNARLAKRLVYTPQDHMLYPDWYAGVRYPDDEQARKKLTQYLATVLRAYPQIAKHYGLIPNSVPDAASFYLVSAYRVFDGDHYADMVSARVGYMTIVKALAHNQRIISLSESGRQMLTESYAARAILLNILYENASRRHDVKTLGLLRADARQGLQQELGADPSTIRLDRLACFENRLLLSCDSYLRIVRASAGGAVPAAGDWRRMLAPAGS